MLVGYGRRFIPGGHRSRGRSTQISKTLAGRPLAKVRKLVGRDPQAFTPWPESYRGPEWLTWALFTVFLKFVPLRRSENFNFPALEGAQWAFFGCFQIFVPFFPPVLSKSEAQKGTKITIIAENAH